MEGGLNGNRRVLAELRTKRALPRIATKTRDKGRKG